MEFFELKLIEKIGQVFSIAMHDRKYNRYQFIKKWCFSNTCQAVFDFDETLCSQAKSYIYWFGYLITYWHFLYGISGKEIMQKYDVCKILDEFDPLHTLSIKAAIDKIREDDRNE